MLYWYCEVRSVEEQLLWIATMIGTVACGVSGSLMAVDKGMDIIGVLVLGAITAVGGGVLRDVLLGRLPPQMFTDSEFLLAAAVTALLVFVLCYCLFARIQRSREKIDTVINVFDAIGLAAYSVVGARATVDMGFADNHLLVIFLGVTTAVGGGILRDMLCVQMPFVLYKRVYVLAAIGGCVVYDLLYPYNELIAMLAAMALIVAVRLLATHFRWRLPRVHSEKNQ